VRRFLQVARRVLVVSRVAWSWFGPVVALRFLLLLPVLATNRKGLPWAYDCLGTVSFKHPFEGRRLYWFHPDLGFIREIFEQRDYTGRPGMEIGKDDIVVDVGAHVGVFTVFAAAQASRGRVVSVEANGALFGRLLKNISANALTNVTAVHAALAPSEGEATLWHGIRGNSSDSLVSRTTTNGELVATISPAALMARHHLERVDFLKLDIEGAEYQIFSGDLSWLSRVRRVAMEAHGGYGDPTALAERFKNEGFQVYYRPITGPYGTDALIYAIRLNAA